MGRHERRCCTSCPSPLYAHRWPRITCPQMTARSSSHKAALFTPPPAAAEMKSRGGNTFIHSFIRLFFPLTYYPPTLTSILSIHPIPPRFFSTVALETGEHRAGGPNCGTEVYRCRDCCRCNWKEFWCKTKTCNKSRPRKCISCPPGKTQMVQIVVRMCVCACVCVCFYGYACSRHNAESIRSQQRKEKRAGPADCSRTSRRRVSLCNPRPSLPFVMFVPSP